MQAPPPLQTNQLEIGEGNAADLLDDGGFEADDFELQQLLGQLNFVRPLQCARCCVSCNVSQHHESWL